MSEGTQIAVSTLKNENSLVFPWEMIDDVVLKEAAYLSQFLRDPDGNFDIAQFLRDLNNPYVRPDEIEDISIKPEEGKPVQANPSEVGALESGTDGGGTDTTLTLAPISFELAINPKDLVSSSPEKPTLVPSTIGNARSFAKVLRPVQQLTLNSKDSEVNIDATVEQWAESKFARLLSPIFNPLYSNTTDICILVDVSPTLGLQPLIAEEITAMLRACRIFRSIRFYQVDNSGIKPVIRTAHQRYPTENATDDISESQLRRECQNHIVVFLTDGLAPAWWSGEAFNLCARLGQEVPITVWQSLPERLWHRTAFGVPRWMARGTKPLALARKLDIEPRRGAWSFAEWYDLAETTEALNQRLRREGAIPLPMIPLTTLSFDAWSRSVAGRVGCALPAVRVLPTDSKNGSEADNRETFDWWQETENSRKLGTVQERVAYFQSTASPDTQRFAALVAHLPLLPEVLRLVQARFFPSGVKNGNIAELLLSPLVRRTSEGADRFAFIEGVAEQLRSGASISKTLEVFEVVGDYLGLPPLVTERFGRYIANEQALDRGVPSKSFPIDQLDQMLQFALFTGPVLRQLGLLDTVVRRILWQDRAVKSGNPVPVAEQEQPKPVIQPSVPALETIERRPQRSYDSVPDPGQPRILVINDEAIALKDYWDYLKYPPNDLPRFHVVTTNRVEEGIEEFRRNPYDLLIIDLLMPLSNQEREFLQAQPKAQKGKTYEPVSGGLSNEVRNAGFSLLDYIRARLFDIPILIFSFHSGLEFFHPQDDTTYTASALSIERRELYGKVSEIIARHEEKRRVEEEKLHEPGINIEAMGSSAAGERFSLSDPLSKAETSIRPVLYELSRNPYYVFDLKTRTFPQSTFRFAESEDAATFQSEPAWNFQPEFQTMIAQSKDLYLLDTEEIPVVGGVYPTASPQEWSLSALLESVPIHRTGAPTRRLRGIGLVLIARLIERSMELGYGGALMLRAPDEDDRRANGFLTNIGFEYFRPPYHLYTLDRVTVRRILDAVHRKFPLPKACSVAIDSIPSLESFANEADLRVAEETLCQRFYALVKEEQMVRRFLLQWRTQTLRQILQGA